METIIAALISAAAAIIVSIVTGRAQHNKLFSELRERDALQAYRLEQLEQKVDKHNNVIERTFKLEEHATVTDEKIKVANHRISNLENKL